jgi:glycosyltransferase involved in cell wall biosynthesis
MKPPFFSIVIPTYNRADLILDTLESVLSQTYKEFEVIVVDNCSTDNTKDVLLPYIQNGSISFIQHEKNYERSKSRNTGIKHAKGDYITFLDSDDFIC